MNHEAKIRKVLVVLSPDLIQPDKPLESRLIKRAVALAQSTSCELELFHVCYDGKLDSPLIGSAAMLKQQRDAVADADATKLAEMAAKIRQQNIKVRHEVRWDAPRTDAILRKIAQARPDLVMKQAREHSYILGITSNTDWELARRSAAHVWLVGDDSDDINRIVAAIGDDPDEAADVTTTTDYEILRTARSIARSFDADIYSVNAYQVPGVDSVTANIGGIVAPQMAAIDREKAVKPLAEKHKSAVQAFGQMFLINPDNMYVQEGHPSEVIPNLAEKLDADLVIIGAGNISRFERLISDVTVEPVIARTDADILIVRDPQEARVPVADRVPEVGVPKYDLESAIMRPAETFESPQAVAALDDLSVGLRKRILQVWQYDIRAAMTLEAEGGSTEESIDVAALGQVSAALEELDSGTAPDDRHVNRLTAA